MPYAPTLTPVTTSDPAPRVNVLFSALAPNTQTITVYRVAEGREMKVRGGVRLFAVGGAPVVDQEAPFDTQATYRAEMFDAASASLGFTDAAPTVLGGAASGMSVNDAWVHQPLRPSLAVKVKVMSGSADQLERPTRGEVLYPEGAVVGVHVGARRIGVSGLSFTFLAGSAADADELDSMLGGYTSDMPAILCIRTRPPRRVPRTLFLSVSMTERGLGARRDRLSFSVTGDEVRPPAPGLVIPTLKRADIDAAFPTRAARAAAYATRLQRDTDYSKAGLSGP